MYGGGVYNIYIHFFNFLWMELDETHKHKTYLSNKIISKVHRLLLNWTNTDLSDLKQIKFRNDGSCFALTFCFHQDLRELFCFICCSAKVPSSCSSLVFMFVILNICFILAKSGMLKLWFNH